MALKNKLNRFVVLGLMLASSNQVVPEYKYTILKNIRQYQAGIIQPRKGLGAINSSAIADTNIHSIARLNDETPSASQAYGMFLGAGSAVYSDGVAHNSFTSRSTGWSGNPLCMIPFRPNNSPAPYLYVADSSKYEKFTVGGTVYKWGITNPTVAPNASIGAPTRTIIDSLQSTSGWTNTGVAGAFTNPSSAVSLLHILYDSGSTGWCNIVPNAIPLSGLQLGQVINLNNGGGNENVIIEEVLKPIKDTTISSIKYDSGSTGLCTIVLTDNSKDRLVPNALIRLAGAENVRVLSVAIGDDNTVSFRCSTIGARSAGNTATGLASVRVYTTLTHTTGATTYTSESLRTTLSSDGIGYETKTGAYDLSSVSGRAIQDDDEINLNISFLDPTLTSEVQLRLYVGSNGDYYYVSVRPSDITGAADATVTTLATQQKKIQRDVLDTTSTSQDEMILKRRERLQRKLLRELQTGGSKERIANLRRRLDSLPYIPTEQLPTDSTPTGSSIAGVSGASQYTAVRVKVKDLKRVGSDFQVGLRDVTSLQFVIVGLQNARVDFSGFWIGGAYGADVGTNLPNYIYRYRYGQRATGARSNWSPPMRSGVAPRRNRVQLTATASSETGVDMIEWARFGGSLPEWRYIGTAPNSTATFNDDFPDDVLFSNPTITFDKFVPFPVADVTRVGVCNVVGSKITRTSGDTFNTKYVEGTTIIVDNVACTLYTNPTSTTEAEITQNLGTRTGVTFVIPEPIMQDQCLPAVWGSYGIGERSTVMFACGDTNNAGTLYWTNPDDPDSASDRNFLEVTTPSEPLVNGCLLDNKAFVFSSERLYAILPSPIKDNQFITIPTPCTEGLFGRYAIAVGNGAIFFLGKDGIYATQGGEAFSLTDDSLYPLFPHDGIAGTSTNGVIAPDMTSPNSHFLSVGGGKLRYDYLGTDAAFHTIIFRLDGIGGRTSYVESIDDYSPTIRRSYYDSGRGVHRWLLGGNDGRLYIYGGANGTATGDGSAGTTAISCQVRSNFEDFDASRVRKFYSDLYCNLNPDQATITLQPKLDDGNTADPTVTTTNSSSQEIKIIELNTGAGVYAKNIGLDISWSSSTRTPKLYDWGYNYEIKPTDTIKGATDIDNAGYEGLKFFQGFYIKANTYGSSKTFKVQADNGTNGAWTDIETFTITLANEATTEFSFATPFTAHNVRIISADTTVWQFQSVKWVFEPEPPEVLAYITQPTSHDLDHYHHIKELELALLSNDTCTLTITIDGTSYTYSVASTGGVKKKVNVMVKAIKGKYFTYKIASDTSNKIRLYLRDIAVQVHDWESGGGYRTVRPFGAPSREAGALI